MPELKEFKTSDGLELHYRSWIAGDASAPCAIYLHGLESHMGWFTNLAEYLNGKGINVYAFDRRGSGSNKERSVNFTSERLFGDLKSFLELVRREHPVSPVFLIGLCLGGKLAAGFFSRYPRSVDGLILISPSLKTKLKFSPFDKLSMLFNPDRRLKVPIEDRMFTSNESFLDYIEKDPLRLETIPGAHLLEIAKMDRCVKEASANINVPMLLMLAGIDEIIDTGWVEKWYGAIPSKDKTINIYKDYYHILTFEKQADTVMRDAADWILARADAKSN